jgi:hypothetical protein
MRSRDGRSHRSNLTTSELVNFTPTVTDETVCMHTRKPQQRRRKVCNYIEDDSANACSAAEPRYFYGRRSSKSTALDTTMTKYDKFVVTKANEITERKNWLIKNVTNMHLTSSKRL